MRADAAHPCRGRSQLKLAGFDCDWFMAYATALTISQYVIRLVVRLGIVKCPTNAICVAVVSPPRLQLPAPSTLWLGADGTSLRPEHPALGLCSIEIVLHVSSGGLDRCDMIRCRWSGGLDRHRRASRNLPTLFSPVGKADMVGLVCDYSAKW